MLFLEKVGSKISFKIVDNKLLEKSLLGLQKGNVSEIIFGHVKEYNGYFKAENLHTYIPSSENTDYLNSIIKKEDSFTESMYNSFLCCLLDGYKSDNKDENYFHKRESFENFYKSIQLPSKRISDHKTDRYNAILERIYIERPYIKNYGLEMQNNWSLLPKESILQTAVRKATDTLYKKISLILILLILIILTLVGWDIKQIKNFFVDKQEKELQKTSHCYFTPDSTKHQILILPFKDMSNRSKNEDTGAFVWARLDSLNKADKLNLDIKFCDGFTPRRNDLSYFKQLKKDFKADHIIYGFYSKEEGLCNDVSESNKLICLNYITNFDYSSRVPKEFTHNSYGNFSEFTFKKLNQGYLQENIDFLIYYNAMLGIADKKKYKNQTRKYFNKLFKVANKESKGNLHSLYSLFNFMDFNDFDALLNGLVALSLYKEDMSITDQGKAHCSAGRIFSLSGRYERARYHLTKCFEMNSKNMNFDLLFHANFQLGYYYDNVAYTDGLLKEIAKNQGGNWSAFDKYHFKYINSYAKKLLNKNYNFKSDSISFVKSYKMESGKNFIIPYSTLDGRWDLVVGHRLTQYYFDGNTRPIIDIKDYDKSILYNDIQDFHELYPKMMKLIFKNGINIDERRSDGKIYVQKLENILTKTNNMEVFLSNYDKNFKPIPEINPGHTISFNRIVKKN